MPTEEPLRGVRTIEQTGKFWKGLQLGSFAVWVVAVIIFAVALSTGDPGAGVTSSLTFLSVILWIGSIAMFIIGKVGAWWHHG